MNGPVEEGSKVATSLIDSLKAQPATLALVVVILVFLGAVIWTSNDQRRVVHEEIKALLEQNAKMSEWLYRCTPSGQHTEEIPVPTPRPPNLEGDPT